MRAVVENFDISNDAAATDGDTDIINRMNIFTRNYFNDNLNFLETLSDKEKKLLYDRLKINEIKLKRNFSIKKLRRSAKMMKLGEKNDEDDNDTFSSEKLFPCCHFYQMYSRLVSRDMFYYLRLEYLREKEFSKTFDTLLTLLCRVYNERTYVLFQATQYVENLLFFEKNFEEEKETQLSDKNNDDHDGGEKNNRDGGLFRFNFAQC